MAIKIIATDLDGTLMAPDHLTVTQRTVNALKEASRRGVKIAVATGRTFSIIENVIEQIPFADYIIYSNGAGVYDIKKQKIIFSDFIPAGEAAEVISYLNEIPACYEAYYNGTAYMQSDKAELFNFDSIPAEFLKALREKMIMCNDILKELDGKDIEKINIYYVDKNYLPQVKDYIDSCENLIAMNAFDDDIEVTRFGVDKACALDGICARLGFTRDNVIAFGDAQNDCGMLKYASYSFAMGNASALCKESARFICESNANDGLAISVENFVLNQK